MVVTVGWTAPQRVQACRRQAAERNVAVRGKTLQASTSHSGGASSSANAFTLTAGAAASALLAKFTILSPSALLSSVLLQARPADKPQNVISTPQSLSRASKVSLSIAAAPSTSSATTAPALPADWLLATSAAHWFEQHRIAAASGALLATVFVSDSAAKAHGPLLESLRRSYGKAGGPVHFIFVHIADKYEQRSRAATSLRGSQALADVGRVSHDAAVHGLDVALSAFLPASGLRAFPSLLLTQPAAAGVTGAAAGPPGAAAEGKLWSAATRVGDLRQLVSDWAFINRIFAAHKETMDASAKAETHVGNVVVFESAPASAKAQAARVLVSTY